MDLHEKTKEAAVIVLHELASDSLILTLRSTHLRSHPGEVCFPGGHWQEGDNNFYNTALRELQEELGIQPKRVCLIRPMALERTLRGIIIYPWLASIEELMPYQVDNKEVSQVFSLPMREIIVASNYKAVEVVRYGFRIKSHQFIASPYFVWGATARIMMQLSRCF